MCVMLVLRLWSFSSAVGKCMCLLCVTWSCVILHREAVAGIQVGQQVFSHTFEWEERVGLCTEELVMFEVAMECHGNRFRAGDHSAVSLEPLKETLFNPTEMQLADDTRGVHDRVVEDIKHCVHR